VFKQLTGLGKAGALKHLWQAPFTLHANMLAAIHAETVAARAGKPARISAKMNSLPEPEINEALYEASNAGVTIDLIVRGACSLRPGVKGLSEKIRVRSIIGRLLEHHRIFYFHAQGAQNIYLSSADWMERNFFRRIETWFPVLDPVLKEGLQPYLSDNIQAGEMDGSGNYSVKSTRRSRFCAQDRLMDAMQAAPISAS